MCLPQYKKHGQEAAAQCEWAHNQQKIQYNTGDYCLALFLLIFVTQFTKFSSILTVKPQIVGVKNEYS